MVSSQKLHVCESVSIILLGYFNKTDPGGQLECEPVSGCITEEGRPIC